MWEKVVGENETYSSLRKFSNELLKEKKSALLFSHLMVLFMSNLHMAGKNAL